MRTSTSTYLVMTILINVAKKQVVSHSASADIVFVVVAIVCLKPVFWFAFKAVIAFPAQFDLIVLVIVTTVAL